MTTIVAALRRVNDHLPELLSERFINSLATKLGIGWRKRVLHPAVMVHVLIMQILFCNAAYTHLPRLSHRRFTAAAFCKAKQRLPLALLDHLIAAIWRRCSYGEDAVRFHGHRTFFADGSSASVPDTPSLQGQFGLPTSIKLGCGFPVMKLLMLFDASTGLIRQVLQNPYRSHESRLIHQMHPLLEKGDVLVADRGFCSFVHLANLLGQELHGLFRLHQRVKTTFEAAGRWANMRQQLVRILGPGDQLVVYCKLKVCPKWISQTDYDRLPQELILRELRYRVGRGGFRSQEVTLVTTLLDPQIYPAAELVELYGRRWQVELNFRHLKTTLKMEVLHGKSPKMVQTEILAYVLVYNLVQLVIHEAARKQGVLPERISFVDAVRWITTADGHDDLSPLLMNPLRLGRFEPRVRKRRHNGYSYMMRPRAKLKAMIARGENIGCK